MNDWTSGYVADIGYTFGYYTELNPLRLRLAFLNAGLSYPECGAACELGFGQGVSANLHAAASVTQWYGTDFNPSQASFAQELASITGAGAKLYDDSFVEFAGRNDLPDFDFIGLHGIWSWISDENRSVIVDFIKRKLKVGGVLYISYNTMPGWAAFAPMRHLMTQHAETIGAAGHGIVSRINGALGFAEKLLATNPAYARTNPSVENRVEKLKSQSRDYLAHEYFNRDWHPMYFSSMAEWLAPAKLSYACSAHYLDQVDVLNLTGAQQELLREIPDGIFRESVRDYMTNQQFRKDYWIKGPRRLSVLEAVDAQRNQKILMTAYRPDITLKVNGSLGEASLHEPIYGPILDQLADHKPKTIGEVEKAIKNEGISFNQLAQAVTVLTGGGHLSAVQDDCLIERASERTSKLNAYIVDKARGGSDISFLASPVSGGGIAIGRVHQLFLLALQQGIAQHTLWPDFVWNILSSQGQQLLKEGKTLDSEEENLAELTSQAREFATKKLPIAKALQLL